MGMALEDEKSQMWKNECVVLDRASSPPADTTVGKKCVEATMNEERGLAEEV